MPVMLADDRPDDEILSVLEFKKRRLDDHLDEHLCSSERTYTYSKPTSGDGFDQAMSGNTWMPDGSIRSSWLNYTGSFHRDSEMDYSETDPSDMFPIREQIKGLHLELCQIKQRLGPAAEQCAEVFNAKFGIEYGDDSEEDVFETNPTQEFELARRMCNPFEELGEGQHGGLNRAFMNRSAIKLANMNALLDFALTHYDGVGPFLFADLCGAPGGFSEYIMRQCHNTGLTSFRGYGMSLFGKNEHGRGTPWKLQHMIRMGGGSFTHYRVCKGADGTGDIYNWDNVEAFRREIQDDVDSSLHSHDGIVPSEAGKVHLVVADGGFDAQRDYECQEQLAQKIVVCQAAAAAALLRRGGTFVVKMFGFQTSTVRTVMRHLASSFEKVTIFKPVSSRPASGERYAVFTGYDGTPPDFDGLKWRSRMFLGDYPFRHNVSLETVDHERVAARLFAYLDRMDRGILILNTRACFGILSHLEREYQIAKNGDDSDIRWLSERQPVDMYAYERAWHIG